MQNEWVLILQHPNNFANFKVIAIPLMSSHSNLDWDFRVWSHNTQNKLGQSGHHILCNTGYSIDVALPF